MTGNMLVFHDTSTELNELIEHVRKNQPNLCAQDVDMVRAAQAAEGEVWSPQLPPYRAWASRGEAGVGDQGRQGADGDLLVVGALGMGLSDEEREKLLAHAAERGGVEERIGKDGAAPFPSAGPTAPARERMGDDLRGALRVRQDADGYALVGFDLRRLAAAAGSDDGLVVSLPAFVDGVPVVRVTAEAFTRRLVQGVGVRLLAMPDTVQIVGANAFLALSVQHIHVGAGVRVLGEQPCDLAGVSPRLKRREYSVDVRNGRFCARDGNLFADGGSTLLFLASPYDERIELPAGVERIGASAFAAGCESPSVVSCPPTLARVDAKGWDDAVWLCPSEALAHRPLAARGVRLAGPRAVELDGCWYDFDDAGAVLVAGPPAPTSVSKRFAAAAAVRAATLRGQSAVEQAPSPGQVAHVAAHSAAPEDALVLPRSVEGRPLVRVGVRALPYAPASLVVADTVRVVERDNACRNAKRLVLPEGLEAIGAHCFCSRILEGPVSIPASVRSIGEGSFEYAVCRLERTGTIVHVSADQLLTCFLTDAEDGVPFDYGRYDELLRSGKNLPDKLGAVLHRLTVPYRLEDATRTALVAYLRDHEHEAQQRVAQEGDRAMVEALVRDGFVDERTFDRQIELLRACNRTDCVLYLMEQHRAQSKPTSVKDRFAL